MAVSLVLGHVDDRDWTGIPSTEGPRYNDSVCYKRFCCKVEFVLIKKLDTTHLSISNGYF